MRAGDNHFHKPPINADSVKIIGQEGFIPDKNLPTNLKSTNLTFIHPYAIMTDTVSAVFGLCPRDTMKKVFISYSHKDKEWVRDWLLPKLESAGVPVHIDFRDFEFGVPLVFNIERAIEKCAKTLLVLSPNWINSEFAQFEALMLQTQDPLNLKKRTLPLMLDQCALPPRLKIFTYGDFRNRSQWQSQIETIIEQIKKDFSQVEEREIAFGSLADENIHTDGLPETGYELFGRQKELKILNDAWEWGDTNVLSFVAYGGVGKTTLVNKWLERMRWDNYYGAQKVFGWSFYSQGTKERVTSADKFVSEALAWFGDPNPNKGSPWDKGQRLADLVRKEKTLLILDGLEPLQSAHDYEKGKIKDPALSLLVTQLARNNNGLCVITTREKVGELGRFDKGVEQLDLDHISKEAGRALLRLGGVQGTDMELEGASEEFGNHALAVNLLGSFLHEIEGHHVKNASAIPDLDIREDQGRHARRVIEAFEKRFGEGPVLQLLRILGLFDRPVEKDTIKAVYTGDHIGGLTDKLHGLTEPKWYDLLEELSNLKLLAKKSTHRPDTVDCHPLVREHFGQKLKETNPEGWRQAHGRLYEYYKELPEKLYGKFLPDTLEEMEPLFAAVSHGCHAGRHQETLDNVYSKRITRGGTEAFINRKLGAFGADLMVLSAFFRIPWSEPASGLRDRDKAFLLNWTGFALAALGRSREATQPMQAALKAHVQRADWQQAAIDAQNLTEFYFVVGELKTAVDYGRKGVESADRSAHDAYHQCGSRTLLGHILHQYGEPSEANTLFRKAEDIQKKREPDRPYLYSVWGFRFCNLLLSQGEYREVQKRAAQTLQWSTDYKYLLDIALDNLLLGCALTLREQEEQTGDFSQIAEYLNQAVDGLRQSGHQDYFPLGLFARAALYRLQKDFAKEWDDLAEANETAERGEMKPYLADYHLEAARLCLSQGERVEEAHQNYEEAANQIKDMGYHRRDPEVLLIKAELEIVEGDKKAAKKTLKKAKDRIDEMGCHRWDIEVERLKNSV